MLGNLTGKQILLIIVGVIVLLYVLSYFTGSSSFKQTQQVVSQRPSLPVTQGQTMESMQMQPASAPYTLYNFYSPNCGHSVAFMPAWNALEERLRGVKSINTRAVDATKPENSDLAFYYNISGYPTVILATPTKPIEYTGDRTVEDLHKFVMKNMQK